MSDSLANPHNDSYNQAKGRGNTKRWKLVLPLATLLLIVSIYILYSFESMKRDSTRDDEKWSDEELENNQLRPKIEMDLGHGPVAHETVAVVVEGNVDGKEGNRTER